MAFRRIVRIRPQSRGQRFVKRTLLSLIFILVLLGAALLLFVNGNTIRQPLADLLARVSGSEVSIESAEFSPLYPQVLKLNNVRIGQLSAGEIYAEYSLADLFSGNKLHFYDLYIKDARYSQSELQRTLLNQLPFESVQIDTLRLNSIPLNNHALSAKSANVRLYAASFALPGKQAPTATAQTATADKDADTDLKFSFTSGESSLNEVTLRGLNFKSLSAEFAADPEGLRLPMLQAEFLGGTISGRDGLFKRASREFSFAELNASRLTLKDGLSVSGPYTIKARQGNLSSIFVEALPGLNLSALAGSYSDLTLKDGKLSLGSFKLQADEVAAPALQLSLTDASLRGSLQPEQLELDFKGSFLDGSAAAAFTLNNRDKRIDFERLEFKDNTLELKPELYDFIRNSASRYQLSCSDARASNLKFLSFIQGLPLSIEKLDLQGAALSWDGQRLTGNSAGLISTELNNLLYSDLLISRASGIVTLTDELLSFTLPEVFFTRSGLSLTGALSFNQAQSYLILNAPDFAAEDLNSELFAHLFQGRLKLQADLRAPGPFSCQQLPAEIYGSLRLNSESLLVSKFGLDLINGGSDKPLHLDVSSLLSALSAADTGLYDLQLEAQFTGSKVKLSGSADSPSSEIALNGDLDLKQDIINAQAVFTSPAGDSVTELKAQGSFAAPAFEIKPLRRGELRPGLLILEQEAADAPASAHTANSTNNTNSASNTVLPASTANTVTDPEQTEPKSGNRHNSPDNSLAGAATLQTGAMPASSASLSGQSTQDSDHTGI